MCDDCNEIGHYHHTERPTTDFGEIFWESLRKPNPCVSPAPSPPLNIMSHYQVTDHNVLTPVCIIHSPCLHLCCCWDQKRAAKCRCCVDWTLLWSEQLLGPTLVSVQGVGQSEDCMGPADQSEALTWCSVTGAVYTEMTLCQVLYNLYSVTGLYRCTGLCCTLNIKYINIK